MCNECHSMWQTQAVPAEWTSGELPKYISPDGTGDANWQQISIPDSVWTADCFDTLLLPSALLADEDDSARAMHHHLI